MKKKTLSLALALALCLGLTVPAFAADPKAGDTTVTDDAGMTYTFSKPIMGTEKVKFNYTLSEDDLEFIDWMFSEYPEAIAAMDAGMMFDKDIANRAENEVTALLVPMGTRLTSTAQYLNVVAEDAFLMGQYLGMYGTVDFLNDPEIDPDTVEEDDPDWVYWYETYEVGAEQYAIKCTRFVPGAVFFIRNEGGKGGIFVKLVDDKTTEPETPVTPTEPTNPKPETPVVTVEDIPASGTAVASTQTVTVDGKAVEFQMYALLDASGNGTNYIKLRDMAHVLNGTQAQFSVGYDNATKTITVTTEEAYASTGTEMTTPFSGDRAYTGGAQTLQINGKAVDMTAITLLDDAGGGYNYFKLRDLGAALGFNVGWSKDQGVFIESDKPYAG